MDHAKKTVLGAAALAIAFALPGTALSADNIVGKWKTQSGETADIATCGSAYCIKLTTGKYAGRRIGRMKGSGSSFSGTITDPADDKEYSGSAKVGKKSLKMKGCALKIFCKTQVWHRL